MIPVFCSIGIILNELQNESLPDIRVENTDLRPVSANPESSSTKELSANEERPPTKSQSIERNSDSFKQKTQSYVAPVSSKYDMSWVGIYGKSTPEMLVKSWTAWRATQGTDDYAVKALGEVVKGYPEESRHIVLSEVLYKIENEKDYYDFVKYNSDLFESAYAELEKGQEDLSDPTAMVLTALGRCRVKWHFKLAQS